MIKDLPLPKWTERSFNFGYDATFIPYLVERLCTTAPRIEELVTFCTEEKLNSKPGGKWSVKEHIGHLADLEELHSGRLDDFKNGLQTLRAADMSNQKTEAANHNTESVEQLCTALRLAREALLQKLDTLDSAALNHRAMHPRLKQEVNVADILYFVAEHDTHHLTTISHQLVCP
jgi:uncharacterized damage-inducible protein DinB